jgi:hypothetical protein
VWVKEKRVGEMQSSWHCPTCNALQTDHYCPKCGEAMPHPGDLSVKHFLSNAGELFFHWDSKIFRSLRLLFVKPGFLDSEYVRGCRKPYIHPFQMFFMINLLYFVLFPFIGWSGLKTPLSVYQKSFSYSGWASRVASQRATARRMTDAEFEHDFDHHIDVESRSLVLLMVPIFATIVALLQYRKRRLYGEHLVFSFYYSAFQLLISQIVVASLGSLVIAASWRLGRHISGSVVDAWMTLPILVGCFTYLLLAMRSFYKDNLPFSFIKAVVLSIAGFYILHLYRLILFVVATYSV